MTSFLTPARQPRHFRGVGNLAIFKSLPPNVFFLKTSTTDSNVVCFLLPGGGSVLPVTFVLIIIILLIVFSVRVVVILAAWLTFQPWDFPFALGPLVIIVPLVFTATSTGVSMWVVPSWAR